MTTRTSSSSDAAVGRYPRTEFEPKVARGRRPAFYRISLLIAFVFAFQMYRGRKPNIQWAQTGWNWFSLLFLPSMLTEEGLRARRRHFLCLLGFPVAVLAALVLTMLMDGTL